MQQSRKVKRRVFGVAPCVALAAAVVFTFSSVAAGQTAREESVLLYTGVSGERFSGTVFYNETFFVNDPNAPVQILSVGARHVPTETALRAEMLVVSLGRFMGDQERERVREYSRERLRIKINAEGDGAVAVKFAVIAYDAFNEHLGGLTAVTMEPPTNQMEWDFTPRFLFMFKRYGVVGVYVQQVRMANGEIWNFDSEAVLSEFRRFREDMTAEQLMTEDPDG